MNLQLLWQPFVNWPIFYVITALGLGLAVLLLFLQQRGWPLRVASLALLLAAIGNPQLIDAERQALPDIVAVVLDESESQNLGERRAQSAAALLELEKRLKALGNTELRVTRTVTGSTADTDGTRVFSALEKTVEAIPAERYAGAVLITDGQIHDIPAKLSASIANAPIHALLSGSRKEVDRRVVIDLSPRFAITGKDQVITYHIEDQPAVEATADITLRLPDGSEQQLTVPVNTPQTLQIAIDHAGQNLLEIEAAALDNEVSLANNRALAVIKGVRDRLSVLLVSGEPHPGERTWRNLLKSDAAVDLVHFTILRPPEKQDGTMTRELSLIAFPTRELFVDKIASFDLVIFDRYRMQSILPEAYLANVADYVRNGGAVLIASGPDLAAPDGLSTTALAEIMPALPTGAITERPFKPEVSKQGWRHPVTQNLPGANPKAEASWGRWFRVIDANTAPESQTLMQGPDGRPLLVLNHVGQGRVAQFLSDQGWLWARGYEGGGPQIELLRRIAHWLMKEPDLEEEALLARQVGNKIIVERRTMAETASDVTMKKPSGADEKLVLTETTPGLFTAQTTMQETGLHRFTDGTLTSIAAIGNVDNKEFSDVRATADKLQTTADATRAGNFWIEAGLPRISKTTSGLMAGSSWMALRDNQQYRVTTIREFPLFATLASLAALLLVITGMWYREGR